MSTSYLTMPEKLFKVIIIGDPTVGKTSFVQRYVQNSFRKDYKGTVGVDFALKILKWSENQTIKLQLWDIAGQERFTWMTRVYYKDSHGCVIMFDLTNKNSFVNTLKWKRDVDSKCSLPDGSPIPCMLLANKVVKVTMIATYSPSGLETHLAYDAILFVIILRLPSSPIASLVLSDSSQLTALKGYQTI
uniref:Ras-related protein Rab n=1 Tax=Timema shepardi TaxID=629360 RepID=A0A7R9AWV7_TIMSH|nr:unnamed protein product [Timema shepardi]